MINTRHTIERVLCFVDERTGRATCFVHPTGQVQKCADATTTTPTGEEKQTDTAIIPSANEEVKQLEDVNESVQPETPHLAEQETVMGSLTIHTLPVQEKTRTRMTRTRL